MTLPDLKSFWLPKFRTVLNNLPNRTLFPLDNWEYSTYRVRLSEAISLIRRRQFDYHEPIVPFLDEIRNNLANFFPQPEQGSHISIGPKHAPGTTATLIDPTANKKRIEFNQKTFDAFVHLFEYGHLSKMEIVFYNKSLDTLQLDEELLNCVVLPDGETSIKLIVP